MREGHISGKKAYNRNYLIKSPSLEVVSITAVNAHTTHTDIYTENKKKRHEVSKTMQQKYLDKLTDILDVRQDNELKQMNLTRLEVGWVDCLRCMWAMHNVLKPSDSTSLS